MSKRAFYDPALPDLTLALDSDWMTPRIADWLQTAGSPLVLEACRFERFRYRPGERLVCLYEIELCDPVSHSRWRHWVTGVLVAAAVREIYQRRARRAADASAPQLPNPPPAWLQQPAMLLMPFPVDPRLPQLAQLFGQLPVELEQLYRRYFGALELAVEPPQPQRYRPLLSAVFSQQGYRHREGVHQGEPWQVFLKLRADDSGYQRYRRQCQLIHRGEIGIVPASPIGFIPSLQCQIDAMAEGESLLTLLQQGRLQESDWYRIGERLASFHRSETPLKARVGIDSRLARATAAAALISWGCPALREPLAQLLSNLQRQPQDLHWFPCHGDLKPEHLFLAGDKVTVIDLEDLCLSDPRFDLAMLAARLQLLQHTELPQWSLATGLVPLLEGYRSHSADISAWGVGRFYAFAALDMARYAVQHQLPDWRSLVAHFVQQAMDASADGWQFEQLWHFSAAAVAAVDHGSKSA